MEKIKIIFISVPIFIVLSIIIFITLCLSGVFTGKQSNPEYPGYEIGTNFIFESGKFQILKAPDGLDLMIFLQNSANFNVIKFVQAYKQIGDTLYVTSKDGEVIVDGKADTCRVYLANQCQQLKD